MNINYFKVLKRIMQKYFQDDILAYSSQLAYNFLLACFPFLIFIFTLMGYLGIKSDVIYNILKDILPNNSYNLIKDTLTDLMDTKHTTLMSITIIVAIWTASIGFSGVINGINRAYEIKEERSFWKLQIITIVYTLLLALGVLLTLVVIVYGSDINKILIHKTGHEVFFATSWKIIKYVIVVVFLILIFACVYRYTPSQRLPWKNVLPGAVFSLAAWLISSFIYSYYVDYYATYTDLYGSLTAVIVLMIWFFVSSNIILIGGEINAAIYLASERGGFFES